jgi:hypothetical protein
MSCKYICVVCTKDQVNTQIMHVYPYVPASARYTCFDPTTMHVYVYVYIFTGVHVYAGGTIFGGPPRYLFCSHKYMQTKIEWAISWSIRLVFVVCTFVFLHVLCCIPPMRHRCPRTHAKKSLNSRLYTSNVAHDMHTERGSRGWHMNRADHSSD